MNVEVNYLAVLIAAVVSMAVGFIYYSPMVVGKTWMKQIGMSASDMKAEQKKMGKYYAVSFVLALVGAYVLAHVFFLSGNFFHTPRIETGLLTGFWMWLGFVMPTQATGEIFGGKKWGLFAINTGYQLVALLAMGVVIGLID